MKINHDFLKNPAIKAIFDALDAQRLGKVYIVGGAIRDAILGRKIFDVDFATSLRPHEIISSLADSKIRYIPTGLQHGTISAFIDGKTYEITSLRVDLKTDGRHAEIAFTDDFLEDAKRRDFSINVLYCDDKGVVLDPLGCGLNDLELKVIKFVGAPELRIQEDYLRILRLYRFYAQLAGFSIDEAAIRATKQFSSKISTLSRERINVEIKKTLLGSNSNLALYLMHKNGILQVCLEVDCDLKGHQIYCDNCAGLGCELDAIVALMSMAAAKKDAVLKLVDNLRLSNIEKTRLLNWCKVHEFFLDNLNSARLKIACYKFGKASVLDFINANVPNSTEIWRETNAFEVPNFPINGEYLQKQGIKSGPKLGQVLKLIEDYWLQNDFIIDGKKINELIEKFVN